MDLNDIINTLIAEANAEGPEGMRRVGETILNRAAIRGIDPSQVVRQPAQYTGYSAPGPAAVAAQQDPRVRSAAEAAWQLALQPGDPTDGADHYFNPNVVDPGWQNSMQPTGDYGDHTFYRSRAVPADALAALLQPAAPNPQMPPARGNVPSSLIGDSFNALPQRQQSTGLSPSTVKSIVDMFAEPVRDATPRMNASGSVTDPAGIVFGGQMEKDIFPQPARAVEQPKVSTIAAYSTKPRVSGAMSFAGQEAGPVAAPPPTAVGGPPTTRSVASVPMGPQTRSTPAADPVGASSSWGDFAAMFGRPAANYNSNAHPFAGGGPKAIPGPNSPPKSAERLPTSSGINLVNTRPDNFNPYGAEVLPFDTAFVPPPRKRPETRTITEQVPNPDWTADLAAKSVPAGMKVNFGSRDTVAQRAAGAKVPQFITRTRQVPVSTPAAAVPVARAPVPFSRPAAQPTRAPLRVVVNGGNVQQPAPAPSPSTWAPAGFTNDGSGRITSNETGGVYYERHLR